MPMRCPNWFALINFFLEEAENGYEEVHSPIVVNAKCNGYRATP